MRVVVPTDRLDEETAGPNVGGWCNAEGSAIPVVRPDAASRLASPL